jgi:ornithine carbamoyltransferase
LHLFDSIHVAAPKALQPDEDIQVMAQKYAAESSSDILITDDIQQALEYLHPVVTLLVRLHVCSHLKLHP